MAVAAVGCSTALLGAGCGGGSRDARAGAGAAPASRDATADIASFKFVPAPIRIMAGGSVTWTNRDKAPHSASNVGAPGPAQFDTGRLTTGQRKLISFSEPGTYTYYCVYHRFMEATVIVR